jgi:hypothetical protein
MSKIIVDPACLKLELKESFTLSSSYNEQKKWEVDSRGPLTMMPPGRVVFE